MVVVYLKYFMSFQLENLPYIFSLKTSLLLVHCSLWDFLSELLHEASLQIHFSFCLSWTQFMFTKIALLFDLEWTSVNNL